MKAWSTLGISSRAALLISGAVGLLAILICMSWPYRHHTGGDLPLFLLIVAIALASLTGGTVLGLAATCVGLILAVARYIGPPSASESEIVAIALFGAESIAVSVLGGSTRAHVLRVRRENPESEKRRSPSERIRYDLDATEARLKDVLSRFQIVNRTTSDAVWDWDLMTDEIQWNEAMTRMFGYSGEEGRPDHQWWLERVHPEDRAGVQASLQEAVRGRSMNWSSEYRFRRKDGSYANVLDRGSIRFDSSGRPSHMMGAMQDISDLKIREQTLREMKERERSSQRDATDTLSKLGRDVRVSLEELRGSAARLRAPSLNERARFECADAIARTAKELENLIGSIPESELSRDIAKGGKDERATVRPQPLAECRILVVDDAPDNRLLAGRVLKSAGASVDEAGDGNEGVQMALACDYDLVLMDIQMPKMDGYEAVRRLRAEGYRKPIVALTAHAMASDRERCLQVGFSHHLPKPINRRELIAVVERFATAPEAGS